MGKLKAICHDLKKAQQAYGEKVTEKLYSAIDYIESAESIIDVRCYPPFHFHPLKGSRSNEYAIDLGRKLGFRLILKPLGKDGTVSSNVQIYNDAVAIEIVVVQLEEVSNHYE
jgi:proteic killer suppression protein